MSLPKIFIGGDSWACGEWPNHSSLTVIHQGIEEYFTKDGHTVFNTARGGCSNRDSVSLLGSELDKHFTPGDIAIWVQSDPIRNLRPYDTLTQELEQAGGVMQLMKQILANDYARLHAITQQVNTPIYLIGGLLSIQQDQLVQYPELKCLLESWPALLVGNNPKYAQTDWATYSILDSEWTMDHVDIDSFNDTDMVRKVVDELCDMNDNRCVYQDPIFHPNGAHPNREGHKILYNYIKERLEL